MTEPESTDVTPLKSPARGRRRLRWYHTVAILVGVFLLVFGGGSLLALKLVADHYEGMVDRENILEGVPTPEEPAEGEKKPPLHFLILGIDSRDTDSLPGLNDTGSRSDAIMIAHISSDRKRALIVSIPRDSYVDVPAGGIWGGGKNKINAAMSFGGANLAAKTVYNLTKIPLDGAVVVNFAGIQTMVEAVGGVRVCIPYTVYSSFSDKVWEKGCHDLDPAEAEEFVRQRKGTPGGDLGRIKNQQHVIKGLLQKIKQGGMLTDPGKLNDLLTTAARAVRVDENMKLTSLALELRHIDIDNVKFATTPIIGTMQTPAGSSIQLDMEGVEELFTALREDRAEEWLAAHPQPEVASL
ncbi:MAG: transcriptional regulator [Actinobacteria bacterium]|nr:MAG: transcriptional regulator [Actinomycetota bacterium]